MTATDTRRQALASLLGVEPEAVTTEDPGGKIWTVGKSDYAYFSIEIIARDFVKVGQKDGQFWYRIKP